MSRLAVVIPSYNHAHYIGLGLDSCLNQTRKPDRIIVIDDGSKDNSVALLETYRAKGVEVLSRENRGAHNTINQAIQMAAEDCDFISILNSDDHYHVDRFAKLLPLLEENPDKSVVCSGIRVIDGQNNDIPPGESRAKWFRAIWSWKDRTDVDLAEWIGLANFPATTSNVIARREWLLRFPFRPYHFIHDYYFLLQTVLRDQMVLCPEPLVNYRVHATNTINTNPGPLMREMVRMNLDLLHDLAPELPTNAALRSKLATYLRSSWENVSALHQGVLQTMLAQAAARLSEEEILTMTNVLTPEAWSELAQYPNKALVNSWDETGPLGSESGLAEKFASVKSELSARKAAQAAWKDLARLQGEMAQSKWLALGRLFGVRIEGAEKGEPQQRLEALKAGLRSSGWLGFGASLGLGHCRRLRDASKPLGS